MSEGILLTLTHTNTISTSVVINDASKVKPVKFNESLYVPVGGSITVPYTTTVAFSMAQGSIRGFLDQGVITAEFTFGPLFTSALEMIMPVSSGYWEAYSDTQYTAGSPLTILGGNTASLSINGLGFGDSNGVPPTDDTMWDTSTNEIQTTAVGGAYTARVSFTTVPTQVNTVVTVRFTSISLGIDFFTDEIPLSQGAGQSAVREVVIPWFNGTAVTDQGALITLSVNADTDIYNMGIFIRRDV